MQDEANFSETENAIQCALREAELIVFFSFDVAVSRTSMVPELLLFC